MTRVLPSQVRLAAGRGVLAVGLPTLKQTNTHSVKLSLIGGLGWGAEVPFMTPLVNGCFPNSESCADPESTPTLVNKPFSPSGVRRKSIHGFFLSSTDPYSLIYFLTDLQ